MGSAYQTIADMDATAEEAPVLARRVMAHLCERRIIEREETHCVLAEEGLGHRPGPEAADAFGGQDDDGVARLVVNGVEALVGRNVHYSWAELARCPVCGEEGEFPVGWDAAVEDWIEGGGGRLACPACGGEAPVGEWEYEPPWAFTELAVRFWNWPPLSEEKFVRQVAEVLGHRVRLVFFKI